MKKSLYSKKYSKSDNTLIAYISKMRRFLGDEKFRSATL